MTGLSSVSKGIAFSLTLFLALSQAARAESLGFSLADSGNTGSVSVSVIDDQSQAPITDALVTVSNTRPALAAPDLFPLDGEWSWTDFEGSARFLLASPVPTTITVYKSGYSAITLVGVQSSQVTVYLKPMENTYPDVIASGTVGGWRGYRKPVYMGLVFKSLGASDLLHFDMTSVVSPMKDTIDIWGERKIPSNFVMPSQDIPIFLGSAHVDKTDYRLPLPDHRAASLAVVEGEMDSGDLISIGMGGKPDPSALNKFQFNKIGLSAGFVTSGNFTLNVNANLALTAAHQVTVKAPPFNSDVMVAAVADLYGDRKTLVPTDIRTAVTASIQSESPLAGGTVALKSTAQPLGQKRGLVTVAVTRDLKRLSGIITDNPAATANPGDFLDTAALADSQTLPAQIKIRAPKQGLATTVLETTEQNGEITKTFPVWTVFSFPSGADVTVQTANMPLTATVNRYSVVQLEFDPAFDERNVDGQGIMTRLTRFTRSSAKIGK